MPSILTNAEIFASLIPTLDVLPAKLDMPSPIQLSPIAPNFSPPHKMASVAVTNANIFAAASLPIIKVPTTPPPKQRPSTTTTVVRRIIAKDLGVKLEEPRHVDSETAPKSATSSPSSVHMVHRLSGSRWAPPEVQKQARAVSFEEYMNNNVEPDVEIGPNPYFKTPSPKVSPRAARKVSPKFNSKVSPKAARKVSPKIPPRVSTKPAAVPIHPHHPDQAATEKKLDKTNNDSKVSAAARLGLAQKTALDGFVAALMSDIEAFAAGQKKKLAEFKARQTEDMAALLRELGV